MVQLSDEIGAALPFPTGLAFPLDGLPETPLHAVRDAATVIAAMMRIRDDENPAVHPVPYSRCHIMGAM